MTLPRRTMSKERTVESSAENRITQGDEHAGLINVIAEAETDVDHEIVKVKCEKTGMQYVGAYSAEANNINECRCF